jgi:hypothetical protein
VITDRIDMRASVCCYGRAVEGFPNAFRIKGCTQTGSCPSTPVRISGQGPAINLEDPVEDLLAIPLTRRGIFPQPLITAEHPSYCGCSWSYAPSLTKDPEKPFCIKFVNGWCRHSSSVS